jgi:hypothetical protein
MTRSTTTWRLPFRLSAEKAASFLLEVETGLHFLRKLQLDAWQIESLTLQTSHPPIVYTNALNESRRSRFLILLDVLIRLYLPLASSWTFHSLLPLFESHVSSAISNAPGYAMSKPWPCSICRVFEWTWSDCIALSGRDSVNRGLGISPRALNFRVEYFKIHRTAYSFD